MRCARAPWVALPEHSFLLPAHLSNTMLSYTFHWFVQPGQGDSVFNVCTDGSLMHCGEERLLLSGGPLSHLMHKVRFWLRRMGFHLPGLTLYKDTRRGAVG